VARVAAPLKFRSPLKEHHVKNPAPAYDFFNFALWSRLFPGQPPPTPAELRAEERRTTQRESRYRSQFA